MGDVKSNFFLKSGKYFWNLIFLRKKKKDLQTESLRPGFEHPWPLMSLFVNLTQR